jgi:hypothetical protein
MFLDQTDTCIEDEVLRKINSVGSKTNCFCVEGSVVALVCRSLLYRTRGYREDAVTMTRCESTLGKRNILEMLHHENTTKKQLYILLLSFIYYYFYFQ